MEVIYARRAGRNAADDRIVEFVRDLDERTEVIVITSDRALAEQIRALGATVDGAGSLLRRLGR